MKLEEIGFYTLSDERANNTNGYSTSLKRCELILTGLCNFKCPYCRGSRTDEDLPLSKAFEILDLWISEGLENVRFSGGEPTMYKHLPTLVEYCKMNKVKRIAVSTNGSASMKYYKKLIDLGVNDFSISLDACCSTFGDKMAGIEGAWERVIDNIKKISKLTYVTVGVVFTKETLQELPKTIEFASNLGVADIRIISSAQDNINFKEFNKIDKKIINKHPILRYRINNFKKQRNVRGITRKDSRRCHLVKDDMAIEGNKHYPCIIHLRETKKPIGSVGKNMRKERLEWFKKHDCHKDPVCKKNCLDVCVDYNNKAEGKMAP